MRRILGFAYALKYIRNAVCLHTCDVSGVQCSVSVATTYAQVRGIHVGTHDQLAHLHAVVWRR